MSEGTHYRTCPFCEAACGLEVKVDAAGEVVSVRGDEQDVLSKGFLCPKSQGLKGLHEDPDRLTRPLIRRNGHHEEATWEEAFALIAERLPPILEQHGRDSTGIYLGNPSAHNLDTIIYGPALAKAVGTKNIYSASTVDQMPKQVAAGLMFGAGLSVPVPDVDRTDHLMILGANPLVSNGSLLTAPNMRGRIRSIIERGGRVVVIDPRRTRTAREASEHHFIRPGTDALLLAAMANVILDEGLADPGRLREHAGGEEELAELVAGFHPEDVAGPTGIAAPEVRRLAHELAGAERAAVYGRIGTTTQEFGTLASWLVDVLNYLTGNLDREGGAMFPLAAAGQRNATGRGGSGKGFEVNRWQSRVRGLPEAFGELPASCLAEEMLTPGEGQIRAMITIAGNPAVSLPNAGDVARGLEGLDFMVAVDIYVNETTRHADVILPPPEPLAKPHYDLALYQLCVRSVANYSPAVLAPPNGQLREWEILLRLAAIAAGQGPEASVEAWDDLVLSTLIGREAKNEGSPIEGREPQEVMAELGDLRGPDRALDLLLRTGRFGEGFGADPEGLTLARLEEHPHGIDMGPMRPRIPEVLRTPSGRIELAPEEIAADVERLAERLRPSDGGRNGSMLLIGRRQLRSNNSWMHNLPALMGDGDRCTLLLHPEDAAGRGLEDGSRARLKSSVGSIEAPVEVSDEMMPGVCSLPHGWGHDTPGARLGLASEHPGVNSNRVSPPQIDPLSGNAILCGIEVELEAA